MWRSSGNIVRKVPSSVGRGILQQQQRCASGASSSGGAAKAILYTTGALTAGAGGTVGYAWYDPEFRRTIEKNVPLSKDAFQQILGDPRDTSKPLVDFPSVKQISEKVSSIMPARKEQKDPSPSPLPLPPPSESKPAVQKSPPAEKKSSMTLPPPSESKSAAPLPTPPETKSVPTLPPPSASKSAAPEPPKPSSQKFTYSADEKASSASQEGEKLKEAKAEFEEELRKQMARQVAAHTEHLELALKAQRDQLESQAKRELDEAVIKEREIFNREIANSIARLNAIEAALEGRAEQDSENRRAKELWIACQHLRKAVLHGRMEGRDYNARRKPLVKEITAIKEAGAADPFVKTLSNSITQEAVTHGVYSQHDLVERFEKVKKVCRRTALIGENGGTLFQYFLSMMQSFFLFDRVKPDPKQLEEVDVNNIDTVGILWRAAHLVDQLDFDSAIKIMLLLKGEPARLASDWIRDARLHLETRRTAELLLAHASAVSMRTIY